MVDYVALKNEIDTDPLTRGYSGMTDQQVADDMNTVYRTRNRDSMTGDEIFNAADPAEFAALANGQGNNPDEKNHFMAFCGRDSIDPFAANNVQFITDLFPVGSTTVINLQAARIENISRAVELGMGIIKPGHVQDARTP
jgi:hypothetical protein